MNSAGHFFLREVKGQTTAATSTGLSQLKSTIAALKQKVSGAEIGGIEIVIPKGKVWNLNTRSEEISYGRL